MAAVETRDKALALIHAQAPRIRSLGVSRIGLFGSFAHDQQVATSDVDVFVEFEPGRKTYDNFIGLASLMEDVLQRRVELVTASSLSPYIATSILEDVVDVPLGE